VRAKNIMAAPYNMTSSMTNGRFQVFLFLFFRHHSILGNAVGLKKIHKEEYSKLKTTFVSKAVLSTGSYFIKVTLHLTVLGNPFV
jgi:hypothetical protein